MIHRLSCVFAAVGIVAAVSIAAGAVPESAAAPVAGRTVFLDAGHAGINGPENRRQVPTGRGGTKDCQTSGTATERGYTEAAFNFDTVLRIRAALTDLGVRSAMSRGDNNSSGPCIDERAALANAVKPDLIVSVHADGGPPAASGFHVNYSNPPLNEAQQQSLRAAQIVRTTLIEQGLAPATYIGTAGVYGRADLTGLNMATYPAVLIELGNMRNPAEAARMESDKGRQFYAKAVAAAIAAYLEQTPER